MTTDQQHTQEPDPLCDDDYEMNDDQIDALKGLVYELAGALQNLVDAQCTTKQPQRIHACALARAVLAKVAQS